MNETTGQVITFYSYKGGTGRSMALANIACLLARDKTKGKGVLMIDWDLEAPGLHRFFYSQFTKYLSHANGDESAVDRLPGLIDLFIELNAVSLTSPSGEELSEEKAELLLDQIQLERFILETDIPTLHLLKAGSFDETYASRVNTFSWEDLYNRVPSLMSVFARRLASQYQYVLIDSRTGISDITGICTMIMPEKLVAVFTPNRQSLLGLDDLVRRAVSYRKASNDLRPLVVLPLPSRTDRSELELLDIWRFGNREMNIIGYQPLFERLFKEVYDLYPCDLKTYFDQIEIQYIPYFSYGEEIATLIEASTSRLSLTSSYEYFIERLMSQDDPWMQYALEESGVHRASIGSPGASVIVGDSSTVVIHQFFSEREKERYERLNLLQAMLVDPSEFMRTRLESFVGREKELAEIQECIAGQLSTGGYVTITGQAGQGKSSIIAKLIEQNGPEITAYHFIPFNPGPDHQVGLLRNMMARLIIKYDLPDLYVASESRPALRDYLPKVLSEVATKKGREVIFVDGLDQLEEDSNGLRDLSFLPNNPPAGIVFVLGTRPNDTLRSLELLKPSVEYQLPNLSRDDFDLILQRRQVYLERSLADQFYQIMQGNALYLDLVARELGERGSASLEEIIPRMADNPENIFSLSMIRLRRDHVEWRDVIKPILGLLLAAREPLHLKCIREILKVDDDLLREGIERLGGLIVGDGQQRYSLFHLKFQDYLRQNEQHPEKDYIFATDEEEQWHSVLAAWCEKGENSLIWKDAKDSSEQERRQYVRKHYIIHLYMSKQWQKLFHILDEEAYGQAKMQYDPSAYLYALDLDRGRWAAAWGGWTTDEGVNLLPNLWRYTLLRCSLTSRANQYPQEAFEALLSLGREMEALGLAELSTDSSLRANALTQVVKYFEESQVGNPKTLLLLVRTFETTRTMGDDKVRTRVLNELVRLLVSTHQGRSSRLGSHSHIIGYNETQAKVAQMGITAAARTLEDDEMRAEALASLAPHLPHIWLEDLLKFALNLANKQARTEVLSELGKAWVEAQQWEQATSIISIMENRVAKTEVLRELGEALAQAQQWERCERIAATIEDSKARSEVLSTLGLCLAQTQQWNEAYTVWGEAETLARSLERREDRTRALWELSIALAQVQQWERIGALAGSMEIDEDRAQVLKELGGVLILTPQWKEAAAIESRVEAVIRAVEGNRQRSETLRELGVVLALAQQWEQAERVAAAVEDDKAQAEILSTLGFCLVQAQQREQAEVIWTRLRAKAFTIKDDDARIEVLRMIARALARSGEYEQLLYLVQQAWLKADTRELAIKLLPLVSGLISLKPDIGATFYQAFEWVDAFFKHGSNEDVIAMDKADAATIPQDVESALGQLDPPQ